MSKLRDSFLKANTYFKDGNFEEAKDLYIEIIKSNPNVIKAWKNLGLSLIRLHQYNDAIHTLSKALQIEPNNISLLRNLGIAYFHAEDFKEAIKVLKKILESSPNNEKIWCSIGDAHIQLGNNEEAIKSYKYAITLNDRYVNPWKSLCLTYANMGVDFKYDEIRPNTETAWYFLSKALLIRGLFDDALDACNSALKKNPGFQAAHILKNKIKSMIKEQKQIPKARSKLLIKPQVEVKKEGDIYYQRFKKVQEKMHQRVKEINNYEELSLEEKFRLQQEKFKKRMMEIEGTNQIEEDEQDSKDIRVIEEEQKEKITHSPSPQEKAKKDPYDISVSRDKSKKKLIFIDNHYRNIEECHFVVDGANVARAGPNSSRKGKLLNLTLLKKKLISFGITNYMIICDRALYYDMDDKKAYKTMVQKGEIYEMPAGSDADNYILQIVKRDDAYVISNDMFRDKYRYFGKEWIKNRRITFKIIGESMFFDKIFTVSG